MSNLRRILNEAMDAASGFIPPDDRKYFYVVGGAALVRYGSSRKTEDVDIVITPETLNKFFEEAGKDRRFRRYPDDSWAYICEGEGIEGVEIHFDFLAAGGEFAPARLHGLCTFPGAALASLADIAVMKANAYYSRNKQQDFEDMMFALQRMVVQKETFAQYNFREKELSSIKQLADQYDAGGLLESAIGDGLKK